jgi:hypothetical protein
LTLRSRGCILIVMTRFLMFAFALVCAAVVVAFARPATASAGWCWPSCSSYGFLGQWTSTSNGCFYSSGEVCSGWGYWTTNGVVKTCYPACDWYGNTTGMILYGFENGSRIRGRYTVLSNHFYIQPYLVGMGGYLRAQVAWYSGPPSQINVAAVG